MADNDAVIIAGKLNDEELRKSIDSLVEHIETQTGKMAKAFSGAITGMSESLKTLAQEQKDASGATRQASQERIRSYDREAQALQKATRGKQDKGFLTFESDVVPGLTHVVNLNKDVDAQYDQILQKEQKLLEAKQKEEQITRDIAQAQAGGGIQFASSGEWLGWGNVHEMEQRSRGILEQNSAIRQQTQEYTQLEHAVASLLGIKVREVNLAQNMNGAYNTLNESLKKMVSAYNEMSGVDRNSEIGKSLVSRIQMTQKALQDIKNQMSRPTSLKDALGLDEKTLDNIAYKIRQLSSYRSGLNITSPKDKQDIEKVNQELERLKKVQQEIMGQNKSFLSSNNALARSFNYMKNRLAFYFTIGASTAFVKQLVEIRGQYEATERALGVLVNSAERGTQIFKELSDMALVSPYTLIELSNAAKQLVAYDVAAKDVVDTTRRMADIAAAVGVPMERLTYALGQIKAYGYLNSRDARMFLNAGIPLTQALANRFSELEGHLVTTADVYDRIKKKAIEYNDVMAVLTEMTDKGGRFFDFQAKMADTLKVQLANLTLAWNNMLNDIGESSQGMLTTTIGGLKQIFLHWKQIDKIIWDVVYAFGAFKISQTLAVLGGLANKFSWLSNAAKQTGTIANNLYSIGYSIGSRIASPNTWIFAFILGLTSIIRHFNKVKEEAREMNQELAKSAKEAAKSMSDYLNSDSSIDTRRKAESGLLNSESGEKAWENLKEQIELSSDSADVFITQLSKIPNINERISAGFDIAEKIQQANDKLSLLDENALKVSQDSWLNGFFGEGLAEDIEDYIEKFKSNLEIAKEYGLNEAWAMDYKSIASDKAEAEKEMEQLASDLAITLKDRLGADINDPTILTESIDRFRRIIKDKNPQIRGEMAQWFDVKLDELLAKEFNAFDERTSINRQFLTILKRDYSSAFRDVTENILKEDAKWEEDQEKAIKSAAAELKKTTVPEFRNAIDDMVKYMNSQDWRITIWTTMGGVTMTNFQKEFNERVAKELGSVFDATPYKPRSGQELPDWAKEQVDALEALRKERKSYEKDLAQDDINAENRKYSEGRLAAVRSEIEARETLLKLFGQSLEKEKKGRGGSKKDAILELLKQEIDLVKKLQSEYDKLTKKGETRENASGFVESQYENTIKLLNAKLTGAGLPTIDASIIKGNKNDTLEFFKQLAEILESKGLSNVERMKAVEGVIREFSMAIKEENLDKIAKGLNNELGKLKDEYELGVELDANPELGEALLDMFGIDESTLSSSIDDYMEKVQWAFNKAKDKLGYNADLNVFLADEKAWKEWGQNVGLNDEALEKFKSGFVNAQGIVRKWAENTVKQTKDLQYKLADINGKIAFEETKLANLKKSLAEETNEYQKKLLEEQIKDQELTIAKLKEEILELLPTYKQLFGNLADHSAFVTRRLAANYQKMLKNAKQNSDGTYTVTDPQTGQSATLTKKRYEKELDRANGAMLKSQTIAQKIGEAFTKGKDDIIDFAEGINLLGDEFGKMGDLVGTIGNIAESLGADENTVEIINDISASMQGLGTASQGISKIMNGDVIGGLTDVVKGLWDAISTWFDNSDKKILRQITASENAVKDLELAYKDLEYAMNKAYGTAEIQAKQLVITNKELQLAELERQLALQESRKSKNRDEDAIRELKGQIKDLKNDIKDSADDIVNSLLGISGVGDAVENMVSVVTDALRNGEDAMESWNDSIDEMIVNMIKKFAMTNYLGPRFQNVFDDIQKDVDERSKPAAERLTSAEQQLDNAQKQYDKYSRLVKESGFNEVKYGGDLEKWRKKLEEAQREYNIAQGAFASTASGFTRDDLRNVVGELNEFRGEGQGLIDFLTDLLGEFGLLPDDKSGLNLSALQQGIQGITEDQASALEAYWNANTQQQYLQSDLLTQIRDSVVAIDGDAQLGTLGEMLLQLQQSYQVQQTIQGIMEGWTTPNGMAVRVEMS